jgi:hypothetical protein
MEDKQIINWLLSGDPSIRWQAIQSFTEANKQVITRERQRIEKEGWGHDLFLHQDPDGKWGGQLYNHKWISTTYTMLLLKDLGVLPNANTNKGCEQLFQNGIYNDEEIRFSRGQKIRDNGITGLVLGILCYFGYQDKRIHNLADFLIRSQLIDGSWIHNDSDTTKVYAFDITLAVLKGLYEYQKYNPNHSKDLIQAQQRGREFLLRHKLFINTESNLIIKKRWLSFSFPCYWFYDILAALDYFREVDCRDPRLKNAMEIVISKRNKDGTWNLQNKHAGKTFFDMERVGEPSRWNTLRCLRITQFLSDSFLLSDFRFS